MALVYTVDVAQLLGASSTTFYSPPAGYRWVIRSIDVYSNPGIGGAQVNVQGHAGQTFFQETWGYPDHFSSHWDGRVVIDDGEAMSVNASGGVDVTVTAFQLLLP